MRPVFAKILIFILVRLEAASLAADAAFRDGPCVRGRAPFFGYLVAILIIHPVTRDHDLDFHYRSSRQASA